ncbi:MAG: rhodanese-like domain-containing protein [Pseudomonadota bacterium]|nr:rhodanese-like domain-containing protein [Pseudomonadota bacterium]
MQFMQDNIWMILVAVSSGMMLLWLFFGNSIRGVKEVSSAAALQLINYKNALVLDVREAAEFNAGHVLNAKQIPFNKLDESIGELERYRTQPIVVMDSSGLRSSAACVLLNKHGFELAYNLVGGVSAWQKAGLPLKK